MLCDGICGIPGGWQPITNLKDPHVVEIAEFAVTQHNKVAKENLKFESVIKGETQVVAGMNYKLVLAAKDGEAENNYEAVVWEKAWLGYRNLTSFKIVHS
ncbi:Cystatin domain [Dillenia turbinata]|uniref:Cystatin domain n=1 Tax=Dillenia turbinata TaxID=194707 RepID=A0AAN8VZY3_9MAGN